MDLKRDFLELSDQLEHLKAISSAKEKILLAYIRESDELYKELSKKVHEIREKNKAIDEARTIMSQNERIFTLGIMAAALSHEIKNPLISIIGMLNRLEKRITCEEDKQIFEIIKKEALRIEGIISRLSDFYKFKETKKEPYNINLLIKETLSLTGHYLSRFKNIETVLELSNDIPNFHFNKGQIQQVLVNLIMNASQAMLSGGKIIIRTAMEEKDERDRVVVIEVEDTGIGISQENLSKIFQPFFTTKPATEGTGIGLSISKEIIERHGGEISVKSEVGKGTTFRITLPMDV
ncbi:MAG: hypothetical protein OHK0040_10080 [bacterium]